MLNKLLISTALVVGMGTAASAATVSYTASLAPQTTDFDSAALDVQQFDSSLGTLDSIKIELTGLVEGQAVYENTSSTSGTDIDLDLAADVTLSTAALGDLIVALPTLSQTVTAGVFDGSIDFAGTSGATVGGLSSNDTVSTTLLGGFGEFIGTGFVSLLVAGDGNSTVEGNGNLISGFTTFAGADITVTYTFTEAPAAVPLPAGAPLLLLGLGALGIARRRKG